MRERRSCVALGVGRSSIRYRSTRPDQAPLRMCICNLAQSWVRYGYFGIYILLRREGWWVNHKRVHRLYKDEGLGLRLKRPRRHVIDGACAAAPCTIQHRPPMALARARDPRRHPIRAAHRLRVAAPAAGLPAWEHGASLVLAPVAGRRVRAPR